MTATTQLSAKQAVEQLIQYPDRYQTPEDLAGLVRRVPVDAPGSTTVLYSGNLQPDFSTNKLCVAMVTQGESIRIIDKTQASALLSSKPFIEAVARTYGTTPDKVLDDRTNPGNDFLFNGKNGLWAETSERFVNAAEGNVVTATPFADGTRVFAQIELRTALNNDAIHSINDVPKEVFQHIYEQTGSLEVVNKAVAATSFDRMQGMQFAMDGKKVTAVDTAGFLPPSSTPGLAAPTPDSAAMQPVLLPGREAEFEEGRRLIQEARLALDKPASGPFAILQLDDTSTAAFEDLGRQGAIASVLADAADKLQRGMEPPFALQDTNGNDIGKFAIADRPAADAFDVDGGVRIEVDMGNRAFASDPTGQLAHCVMQAAAHIDEHGADANFALTVPSGDVVGKVEINQPSVELALQRETHVEFDTPTM